MVAPECGLFRFISEDNVQMADFTNQVLSLPFTPITLFCLLLSHLHFSLLLTHLFKKKKREKVGRDAFFRSRGSQHKVMYLWF